MISPRQLFFPNLKRKYLCLKRNHERRTWPITLGPSVSAITLDRFFQGLAKMANKPSVFVLRSDVPVSAINLLKEKCTVEEWNESKPISREETLKKIQGKDGLFIFLTNKVDVEFLDSAGPNLKAIGTMSVGYDHIDLTECKKRHIKVGYTPDILTDATADLTIALLLATARRLIEAAKEVTNGGWRVANWAPFYMCGTLLKGSVIGIVGLGRIGGAVAKRLKGFEVESIVYSGHNPKKDGDTIGAKFVPFKELLKISDIIIICCALTPETEGMFNASAFSLMKSNAILINTSRGAIVNQDALYNALKTNEIKAAGLDVTVPEPLPEDHPLTKLNNCVILPHIGSAACETRTEMANMTAYNILGALEGTDMPARLC